MTAWSPASMLAVRSWPSWCATSVAVAVEDGEQERDLDPVDGAVVAGRDLHGPAVSHADLVDHHGVCSDEDGQDDAHDDHHDLAPPRCCVSVYDGFPASSSTRVGG
jgi:hypothetical protein